jgi:hypothetical protein
MALTRGIEQATYDALMVDGFHPVLMVHVDWPDGAVFAHSGKGTINWGGQNWLGVGPFGGGKIPSEAMGGAVPTEASLYVLGTIEDILGQIDQPARNRDVQIYLALVTERAGSVLIGEPVELMSGYIDANELDYREEGEGLVPAFTLVINSGPCVRMALSATHSDEDQQAAFPGDTIMRHAALSELARVNPPTWPAA